MSRTSEPVALVILGRVDFQRVVNGKHEANKAHHVISHLRDELQWSVFVLPHLESRPLPKNPYGASGSRFASMVSLVYFLFSHSAAKLPNLLLSPAGSSRLIWAQARTDFWKRRITQLGAKVVFGIGLTSQEITASRSLGAKTFEIQHGIADARTLVAYWPASKPDFFCNWPTSELSVFADFGLRTVAIPLPSSLGQTRDRTGEGLLVPLSWGEKWADGSTRFCGAFPESIFRLLSSTERCQNLVFRSHPVFPRGKLRRLSAELREAFPGCQIELDQNASIDDFLIKGAGVLLEASAVWLDAARLSIPVITTSKSHFYSMLDSTPSAAKELFHLVEAPAALERLVSSLPLTRDKRLGAVIEFGGNRWVDFDRAIESYGIQSDLKGTSGV